MAAPTQSYQPRPLPPSPAIALEVANLVTEFHGEEGIVRAVNDVSFRLHRGRTLALVGESGCGKSVTSLSLLRLVNPPGYVAGGRILLHPESAPPVDIASLHPNDERLYRIRGGDIGMIFQEPMSALSPVHTVGEQVAETLRLHEPVTPRTARERTIDMLGAVGLSNPAQRYDQYPHELSGGMRQRVVIAMALITRPAVLIADEPTTALDVTLQAQVLGLIRRLQSEIGCGVLLITHDLGVVAQMADEVAVMYLGRIVEVGPVESVLSQPKHPYTRGLLESLPTWAHSGRLVPVPGTVPSLTEIPYGCPFHPRCHYAEAGRCDQGPPPPIRSLGVDREVACHLAGPPDFPPPRRT